MIATAFLLLLLNQSCRSWIFNSTQLQVNDHAIQNVTLTCGSASTNDNSQPKITEVARMYIRKYDKDPQKPLITYAKVYSNNQPAIVVHPADDGVTAHGHAGRPADSYLSVTWKVTSKDTVGTYLCQIDGYTMLDTHVQVDLPPVTLVMAPHEWKDALSSFFEYERRSNELQNKSEENQRQADDFQRKANDLQMQADDFQRKSNELQNKSNENQRQADDFQKKANDFQKKSEEIHSQGLSILKYFASQDYKKRPSQTQWPGGSFALLKADSGCPKSTNESEKWLDGYVRFHTESSNGKYPNGDSVSNSSHMAKPVMTREGGQNLFYMRTCRHEENNTPNAWPNGKYCVLRVGDNRPRGFSHGGVYLDMEDDKPWLYKVVDGPYVGVGGNVFLYFWCVDGGDPSTPIELPVDSPFYLFRRGGQCQQVMNAKVTEESFTVDTEDSNGDVTSGMLPDVIVDRVNPVQFHTCYYQKRL